MSRNIADCVPELQAAWELGKKEWDAKYPDRPKPFLTQTHRDNKIQGALYAQGRLILEEVNKLRKYAGLYPISVKENRKVTNAKPGQSAHNTFPSRAFDIAFQNEKGQLDWTLSLFKDFYSLIDQLGTVAWGGNFQSIPDSPHYEVNNWKSYKL